MVCIGKNIANCSKTPNFSLAYARCAHAVPGRPHMQFFFHPPSHPLPLKDAAGHLVLQLSQCAGKCTPDPSSTFIAHPASAKESCSHIAYPLIVWSDQTSHSASLNLGW